jgi:hypothetical protein
MRKVTFVDGLRSIPRLLNCPSMSPMWCGAHFQLVTQSTDGFASWTCHAIGERSYPTCARVVPCYFHLYKRQSNAAAFWVRRFKPVAMRRPLPPSRNGGSRIHCPINACDQELVRKINAPCFATGVLKSCGARPDTHYKIGGRRCANVPCGYLHILRQLSDNPKIQNEKPEKLDCSTSC